MILVKGKKWNSVPDSKPKWEDCEGGMTIQFPVIFSATSRNT